MSEVWKDVPGFDGQYEASTLGRIRSYKYKKPRILKPGVTSIGKYESVVLSRYKDAKSMRVHRVILETFVGKRPEGFTGSHINGKPSDNRLENLVWETHSENCLRRVEHGTQRDVKGEKSDTAVFTEAQVLEIRDRYAKGGCTHRSLGKEYGVHFTTIGYILKRVTWKHV